jgi:uncharacterized membrane protein
MAEARTHPLLRPWRATTRLAVSTVVGLAVYLGLRRFGPSALAGLLAWDAFVLCFLFVTHRVLADHSIDSMRRRAATLDTRTLVIMFLVVTAACVSLYGISRSLDALPGHPVLRVALAGLTVFGSWSLIHTVFAIHYAHLYYTPPEGGLIFPGTPDPNYYDFLYYSFVVGMTCQVSDVQVAESGLRRLTLIHGVLSFFFNTVILVLAVGVGAGLLSPGS